MALVSAYTLIRTVALFHITLGILLLKNPKLIADQNIVFLMSESMLLVSSRYSKLQMQTTDILYAIPNTC
jgi:hypothetical protein